ncbi:MAG: response regulator [bacterium]
MPLDASFRERLPLVILIVEDNALNLKLAQATLKRLGYDADSAGNGLEAIQAVVRKRYDVVLMDVQMPVLDGLAATRQIRARFGAASAPYVIAMTGAESAAEQQQCLAAGMVEVLLKPVRVDAVAAALTRLRRSSTAPAVLDLDVLARRLDARGEQGLAADLAVVGRTAPAEAAEVATLLQGGNATAARVVATALAGRAGEIGALALAHGATTLAERLARGADADPEPLLTEIRVAADDVARLVASALTAGGAASPSS